MKMIALAALSVALLGATPPAWAQREPLKPAPVPNVGPSQVSPSNRAGRSNGDAVDAPFSGAPVAPIANSGQVTPNNETGTSRRNAPAPNLSR